MRILDEIVPSALQNFSVPGLSVAIVKDDQLVFSRGYGQLRMDEPALVDEHTLFGIASISKTFTATALAMLAGEGRLNWDDPMTDYLPDFRLFDPFANAELRVRDLLIHNSGLREVSGGTLWYGSDYSRAEVIRRLRYLRPVSGFRARFAYQNVTFLVAGEIVRAVSGLSWDDFLRERIFTPLGMTRTTTDVPTLLTRDNVATPHARVRGVVQPVPLRSHDNVGPAASINTSAYELAQYARLHLAGGQYGGQRLIAEKAHAELWTPQTVIPISPFPPAGAALQPQFQTYGLGWYLRDFRGRKVISHSGGVDGYRTLLTLVPQESLGVAVLCNQECSLTHAVTALVLDSYIGAAFTDWTGLYLEWERELAAKRPPFPQAVAGTQPSLPLSTYVGRYLDPAYGEVSISLEEESLVLRFSHTPAFTADLSHFNYDTFRLTWRDPYIPDGLLTFPLDSLGRPTRLNFDQPNLLDVDFKELDLVRMPD